jgi:hypothetical protein
VIPDGEVRYQKCDNCGMQTSPLAWIKNGGHGTTKLCLAGGERRQQHLRRAEATQAQRREFVISGDTLKRAESFKYLGRWLSEDDHDGRAVRAQLTKARTTWARLGKVLRGEYASPRICGKFYKSVIQAVLLFGSETWCLTPALQARLDGFHIRAAYRMAKVHRPKRHPDGSWTYPASEDVLKECGLQTMSEYVRRRRNSIAEYVATRPLLQTCKDGEPRRGTPHRLWWWEQEFSLDEVVPLSAPASDGDDTSQG